MPDNKNNILFVSKHPVHAKMAMAGNQFFYHTLMSFCNDEQFDIGVITVQKQGADFQKMSSELEGKAQNFSIVLPKLMTLFTYLFYNTKLRILLFFVKAEWYLLDPIYRFYFKKAIKKAKRDGFWPKVIVLEWTEVLFLEKFCKEIFPHTKIVVTEHDVSFTKVERRFVHQPKLQKKLVEPFKKRELEALQSIDIVRVLSIDDQKILENNHIPKERIRLVAPFFQKKDRLAKIPYENQIVFYGALGRSENSEAVEWFIDNVYEPFKLSEKVSLVIVGGGNGKLNAQYPNVLGVHFAGYVEQPDEIFVESLCMVVPLLNGGGIKIKVLEGMTCSLPILTNKIGIEGIGGENGVEYLHCETAKDYNDAICLLLDKPERRKAIGENARNWINQHFDYQKDLDNYKLELLQLCNV